MDATNKAEIAAVREEAQSIKVAWRAICAIVFGAGSVVGRAIGWFPTYATVVPVSNDWLDGPKAVGIIWVGAQQLLKACPAVRDEAALSHFRSVSFSCLRGSVEFP
jgi:hypothetical protein